jgi:hypothetical protein
MPLSDYLKSLKAIVAEMGDRKAIDAYNRLTRELRGEDAGDGNAYAMMHDALAPPKDSGSIPAATQRNIGAEYEAMCKKYHRQQIASVTL